MRPACWFLASRQKRTLSEVRSHAVILRHHKPLTMDKVNDDPDEAGRMTKEEACTRFVDLREKISLPQETLFAEAALSKNPI